MKKVLIRLVLALAVVGGAVLPQQVMAAKCPDNSARENYDKSIVECGIPEDSSGVTIPQVIKNVISVVSGIVGVVAVGAMIYGGIKFLTSQGNASKVTEAKNTIIYGIVGLIIALAATTIVNFVLKSAFK